MMRAVSNFKEMSRTWNIPRNYNSKETIFTEIQKCRASNSFLKILAHIIRKRPDLKFEALLGDDNEFRKNAGMKMPSCLYECCHKNN